MPQGAPSALFLLFSSACLCVSLSVLQGQRCLWVWCSCTGEAVCLLLSASFWPCPAFSVEKITYTTSRAVVEPPLCLHNKHPAFSCVTGPFHSLSPAGKCRQTNVPVHFQGLLQTLQHGAGRWTGGSPVAQSKRAGLGGGGWEDAKQEPSARWEEGDELRHGCGLSWHSQLVTAESSRGCGHHVLCPSQLVVSVVTL